MSKVALVTDSTSYIPRDIRAKYPITVAPQVVIWEGQTYEDDVTITPDDSTPVCELPKSCRPRPRFPWSICTMRMISC